MPATRNKDTEVNNEALKIVPPCPTARPLDSHCAPQWPLYSCCALQPGPCTATVPHSLAPLCNSSGWHTVDGSSVSLLRQRHTLFPWRTGDRVHAAAAPAPEGLLCSQVPKWPRSAGLRMAAAVPLQWEEVQRRQVPQLCSAQTAGGPRGSTEKFCTARDLGAGVHSPMTGGLLGSLPNAPMTQRRTRAFIACFSHLTCHNAWYKHAMVTILLHPFTFI